MPQDDSSRKRLVLTTGKAGLSCTLTILPGPAADLPTELEIMALLEEYRLATGMVDHDAVNGLVESAKAQPDGTHHAVIATGTPSEDGVHASFTLDESLENAFDEIARRRERIENHDDQSIASEPLIAEDGSSIDHRGRSAFVIVRRGDTLGTITESTPGRDGVTVRGEVIQAKGGRSLTLSLNNSTTIANGRLLAAVDGRLVHSIDEIRVETTLTIPQDVDYTTGNIDFPGDVVVRGGVKDQFVVRSQRDLHVERLVEAGEIRAGRDARLDRGMAGRGTGTLSVGRHLIAHYLDGVDACVERDCVVDNEVKECTLTVNGTMRSPSCAFYGGVLRAARPVELGTVGSPGGAETTIEIGALSELDELTDRIGRMLQTLDAERGHSADELRLLNEMIRNLTPQQAERLTELQFSQIRAEEQACKVASAASNLLETVRDLPIPRLTVGRALHKGVRLKMRQVELLMTDSVLCPVEIDLSPAGEPRCFLNGSIEPSPLKNIASRVDQNESNPLGLLTEFASRTASVIDEAA